MQRPPLTAWLKFYLFLAGVSLLGIGMLYRHDAPTPLHTQLVLTAPLELLSIVGILLRRRWGLLSAIARALFFVLVGLSQLFAEPTYMPLKNAIIVIALNAVFVALCLRRRERAIFAVDNSQLLLGKSMALAIASFAVATLIGPL